jgi:ribonuclease HIII
MAAEPTSYTFKLTPEQQERLVAELGKSQYEPMTVAHARVAARRPGFNITLFTSAKLLVQGKGAADWVRFTLEPEILQAVVTGYDEALHPERYEPHIGVDESGKGDLFGPLVVAAVYTDRETAEAFQSIGVRDSKTISGDARIAGLAAEIRKITRGRFSQIAIGPRAYNRMYQRIGNLNKLLAWGHARAIENVLEKVPDCPRALSDKFGPTARIEKALMEKGRRIVLDQRTKAESDPAVAAASILARDGFVSALQRLGEQGGIPLHKGVNPQVKQAARRLLREKGPTAFRDYAKCHFKTTTELLAELGLTPAALGDLAGE